METLHKVEPILQVKLGWGRSIRAKGFTIQSESPVKYFACTDEIAGLLESITLSTHPKYTALYAKSLMLERTSEIPDSLKGIIQKA